MGTRRMYTFYSNPDFDKLNEAPQDARPTRRDELYQQAEKLMLADVPIMPIYFYNGLPRHQQPHRRLQFYDRWAWCDMWKVWVK